MTPEQQQAFRAGYADPLIESAQSAAVGTNKARPLISEATAAEFPAFAAPGRADQLGRRLGREQTMFETNQTALGGSRTADNLADAGDMRSFDPGVMASLLRGQPIQAAINGVTNLIANAQGRSPAVMDQIARALIETRPDVARRMFEQAASGGRTSAARRALINAMLNNVGASGIGRAVAGRQTPLQALGAN